MRLAFSRPVGSVYRQTRCVTKKPSNRMFLTSSARKHTGGAQVSRTFHKTLDLAHDGVIPRDIRRGGGTLKVLSWPIPARYGNRRGLRPLETASSGDRERNIVHS